MSLERALAGVRSAQPSQVAGYWANREFWLAEFEHLLDVIDGHAERLSRMKSAYEQHARRSGGERYLDEFGRPKQSVRDTTSSPERRTVAGDARTAIKALADRALDLRITSPSQYGDFIDRLRIENR